MRGRFNACPRTVFGTDFPLVLFDTTRSERFLQHDSHKSTF